MGRWQLGQCGWPTDAQSKPQVVVDFGDGADRRTRRARGGFLLNGDRRRKAVDRVHIGPFHLIQKLPRIGGQGFHVTPLSLGVDRVEREGAFAGTRKTGHDGERIARNRDGNIAEVVLPRAANVDVGQGHTEEQPRGAAKF